jgi:hypothetical protein
MSRRSVIIGFTGTQAGMTEPQHSRLVKLLTYLKGEGADEFRHGDCTGLRRGGAQLAVSLGIEPVIHPPDNPRKRAWCQANRIEPPEPYLKRNRTIARVADVMVATPREKNMVLRSGTWSAIRYALAEGKDVWCVYPDGSVALRSKDG